MIVIVFGVTSPSTTRGGTGEGGAASKMHATRFMLIILLVSKAWEGRGAFAVP